MEKRKKTSTWENMKMDYSQSRENEPKYSTVYIVLGTTNIIHLNLLLNRSYTKGKYLQYAGNYNSEGILSMASMSFYV